MECRYTCVLVTVLLGCLQYSQCVEVKTSLGTFMGTVQTVSVKGVEYRVKNFLGVPYAKPPTGSRRWQKPEEADAFDKPFEANDVGYACPQSVYPGMPVYPTSEDCLTLNLYVPDQSPDREAGHAVMVFIHGGGFNLGAAQTFVGDRMVSFGNVVMVTINYRLGVFGFLDSGDGRVPGNLGFHDQHLALKWVNKHIGAFGGDNSRVTIFGESAGGSSVLFQAIYPPNKGLFQHAISESGVPSTESLFIKNPKEGFDALGKELGCETSDSTLDCMKAKDSETIMNTLGDFVKKQLNPQFFPTIDGEIIPIEPYKLTSLSKTQTLEQLDFYRSINVLIGFNNAEGALFMMHPVYQFEDNTTYGIPREDFTTKAVPGILAVMYGTRPVPEVISTLVASEYTTWSNPDLPENNRDQYIKLWGDAYFTIGSAEYMRLHANTSSGGNTYAYYFTAKPVNHLMPVPDFIQGANHGDELNYLFMFDPEINKMTQDPKPFADWEYELSYRMVSYWTNFAKTGNPNEPVKVSPNWPQFDLTEQRAINFNKDMTDDSIERQFYSRETNFWLNIVPEVMGAVSHEHDASSPFVKKSDGTCDSASGECDGN